MAAAKKKSGWEATPTLYWDGDVVMILDQRRLPGKITYLACKDMRRVVNCIKTLATRGAPAIGVAAAMGLALAARAIRTKDLMAFHRRFAERVEIMRAARPTAVNLGWACDRLLLLAAQAQDRVEGIKRLIRDESQIMLEEDIKNNKAIGRFGAEVVPGKATILTHCNAGSLATCGYGTALGVVRAAVEAGKKVEVIADETRPLLQGARLTAWEMVRENIPVRVAVDSACGILMSRGMVDLVIVGADRVAANGDTANKIGTFNLAAQAKLHGVPFYVAAPLSTIDLAAVSGEEIPIEERSPQEVIRFAGRRLAAPGAGAITFAFDVTPAKLITGIITEKGVLRPPYRKPLAAAKTQ